MRQIYRGQKQRIYEYKKKLMKTKQRTEKSFSFSLEITVSLQMFAFYVHFFFTADSWYTVLYGCRCTT